MIAYSLLKINGYNSLGKNAIEIRDFQAMCYTHFQKAISPLPKRIFENGFYYMKGHIFNYKDNLNITTGIQG